MKKHVLLALLVVSLLAFSACTTENPYGSLPDAPEGFDESNGNLAGQAIEGFSAVEIGVVPVINWDVDPSDIEFSSLDDVLTMTLHLVPDDEVVYKKGYVALQDGSWESFTFSGDLIGPWALRNVQKEFSFSPSDFGLTSDNLSELDNYILLYSCKAIYNENQTVIEWDCNEDKWQVLKFDAQLVIEPVCTNELDCVHDGQCIPNEYYNETTAYGCLNGVWTHFPDGPEDNGTTEEPISCIDSDGGINPDVKGEISGDVPPNLGIFVDRCLDAGDNSMGYNLRETYCDVNDKNADGYAGTAELIACPHGCEDGACLPESTSDELIVCYPDVDSDGEGYIYTVGDNQDGYDWETSLLESQITSYPENPSALPVNVTLDISSSCDDLRLVVSYVNSSSDLANGTPSSTTEACSGDLTSDPSHDLSLDMFCSFFSLDNCSLSGLCTEVNGACAPKEITSCGEIRDSILCGASASGCTWSGDENKTCAKTWFTDCKDWSDCQDGQQKRDCMLNTCYGAEAAIDSRACSETYTCKPDPAGFDSLLEVSGADDDFITNFLVESNACLVASNTTDEASLCFENSEHYATGSVISHALALIDACFTQTSEGDCLNEMYCVWQ
ncbi:hypothetical protein K9M74_00475 [Candidatus Woesearchaeota archaeon]|nr:hypothetical protein [Candidatus Woesearchaeota archaeon]